MGTIRQQGLRNTVVTYAGILIGFVNLIILQPYFLSPEEIGLTRVLYSFSALVAVFIPLGVANITIRYFPKYRSAENKHHGFFGFMLIFPAVGSMIMVGVLYLTEDFFVAQYSERSKLFADYFSYVLPLSLVIGLINVLSVYASALFRTTFASFLNDIVTRVLTMTVISLYYLKVLTLDQFVTCFVGVYGTQLLILVIYIFIIDKPGLRPSREAFSRGDVARIASYGLILSIASFAAYGLKLLDSIMIGKYMALSWVGIYTIAAFIPSVIEAPLNSLERISATKISHAMTHNNMPEVKAIYYQSCRYLFLAGGFLFLLVNINIASLLSFLPAEYAGGINVVFIISLSSLVNMFGGSNGSIIFSSDKYLFGAFLLVMLAGLAFVLNIVLIPVYGIEGAAMATMLATLAFGFLRFAFIASKFSLQPYDRTTAMIAFMIIMCYGLNKLLPSIGPPLVDIIVRSSLLSLVYGSAAYFFRIVPEFHKYIPLLNKTGR